MPTPGRQRVDAKRNRELIVETARTLFAERAAGTTMDEVAKQAGLGPGTLYRHFPDRDSLLHAVVLDGLARMTALAETARAEEPTAWDALSRFVRGCTGLRLDLVGAMARPQADRLTSTPEAKQGRAALLNTVDEIVSAAHAEGTMRRDVGTGDVFGVVSLLIRGLPTLPRELADDLRDRSTELILVGLRNHPWAPPLGQPMSAETLRGRMNPAD